MKYDDTDSNEYELAALQWFEQMQAMDIDEASIEAHRHWLKTPVNAEAYRKVEGIFALIRTLADSPEMALLSEATNGRIVSQRTESAPLPAGTQPNSNRTVKPPSEKPK